MKNFTRIPLYLFIYLSISLGSELTAQVALDKSVSPEVKFRKLAEEAKYIFEAEVTTPNYNGYFSEDSSETYGSSLIDVKKVFKGDLVPGKIEKILSGVGMRYMKDGEHHQITVYDANHPYFSYNKRFIVFADDVDYPSDPKPKPIPIENPQKIGVIAGDFGLIKYPNKSNVEFFGPYHAKMFSSEKEIYDFLKTVPGVNIADSIYQNAASTNPYKEKKVEQQLEPERKKQLSTEEKLESKVRQIKSVLLLLNLRKEKGQWTEKWMELEKEKKKELRKWERRLRRYRKRNK